MASKCNTVFCYLKEQSPTECSASRKTRLQSLFEEENTVNHGIPPATLLEIHEKKDLEEDEEDNKKKVRSVLFYPFVFLGGFIVFSLLVQIDTLLKLKAVFIGLTQKSLRVRPE